MDTPTPGAAAGILERIPLLSTLERPDRLPFPLTGLVGRAQERAGILQALGTARLLTLTGPGGVGKTRLALEVAGLARRRFAQGAHWVELGSLCDERLLGQQVARSLGLPEDPASRAGPALVQHLESMELLLVLDNCEHLVEACAELTGLLLRTCPHLRILATSREPLGVGGEVTWSVPPLSLPCRDEPFNLESLGRSEAGQLFLERARAVRPDLQIDDAAAQSIGQVCCQLDGLPLALELAAARLRALSLRQILEHLSDRFRLLTGGSRTDLPHHQALKATLDWSYDLLAPAEQRLFERLSVFRGGFSLESAEAVASSEPGSQEAHGVETADVLDLVSRLVTKSLVGARQEPQPRFQMLETLRAYAWEHLQASGQGGHIRKRHLVHFLELAQRAESDLVGAGQVRALSVLEAERDNLRAALGWCQEAEAWDLGLRLATALGAFWIRTGSLCEGSGWLEQALAGCRRVGPVRMWGLYQAGRLALEQGAYEQALAYAMQSLAVSRHLRDRRGMARALGLIGWVAHWRGDRAGAVRPLEKALVLARDSGDVRTIARTQLILGDLRLRTGALQQAATLLESCLELYRSMGDGWSTAWTYGALGDVARFQGEPERAVACLRASLALYGELDSKAKIPYPLEALALVAAGQGAQRHAVRLLGAASGLRDAIHAHLPPSYQADYEPYMHRLRAALGEEAFLAAWNDGRATTLRQVLDLAAAEPAPEVAPASEATPVPVARSRPHLYGLTPREVEVLRLVSSGATDAQIAEKLVISPRTVGKHLQSIYGKLYLPSRSAATRWAIEHNLA